MTRKYVLDTNLYIGAIRDPDKEADLDAFLERNAPVTYMSAVVMQELRAGAITDAKGNAEMSLQVDEKLLADSSVLVQANFGGRTATRKFQLRPDQ